MNAGHSIRSARAHAVCPLALGADELIATLLRLAPARRLSLLDSGAPNTNRTMRDGARYLIAAFDPFEIIEADAYDHAGANVFDMLDRGLRDYSVTPAPYSDPLVLPGTCVATLAYDLVRGFERLRTRPIAARREPAAVLAFYESIVIHDYARGESYVTSSAGARGAEQVAAELRQISADAQRTRPTNAPSSPTADAPAPHRAVSNFTADAYHHAVRRVQEHILRGDIYQANLTQQIECVLPPATGAADIFSRLRGEHPASMSAFLHRRTDAIVSISPERFLRVRIEPDGARRIFAAPIKGTRRRGIDADEDARLRHDLIASAKDRAENVMIVDLMRNDLGRVCRYGSVEVAELCRIETHPTLHHLVSTIRGRLREDASAGDILRATFPCGSITGAPKLRAIEILDDIEPVPRDLSMGAIGYFGFDGTMDLNVAIRTMTIRDSVARFNVGGGVTIDSVPEDEYAESLLKARALLAALGATLDPDHT